RFVLGKTSDTDDAEGTVVEHPVATPPTREEVAAALTGFVGEILQKPPAFSALKVAGRRAYDMARAGETVDLAPRPVVVHSLELASYTFPELTVRVECGGGTYIRSLARDLGEKLGTGGLMEFLRRTAVGPFTLDAAVPLDDLTPANWTDYALPLVDALGDLATAVVDETGAAKFRHGQPFDAVDWKSLDDRPPADGDEAAVVTQGGVFLGVAIRRDGRLHVVKGGFG
ncbi:MAG: tRNA pseudouridine synthase B, partial [Planctomycetia bacterium]